jgi:hypothetical protein
MTRILPAWCETLPGRELIEQIIAERPEPRVQSNRLPSLYGGHREPNTATYPCEAASLLRRLHRDWVQHELTALDRQFAITHIWDDDASHAILGAEQPDALIERVLSETAEQFVDVEHLGPGRIAA